VRVIEPTGFRGQTLIEIPDVNAPQLRAANMLLSSGCYDEAAAALEEYLSTHDPDAQYGYVEARSTWIFHGNDAAERAISELVAEHPSFVSGRVLLAGLRIDQHRFAEATAILDDVAPRAPTDLFVFLDRLRIDALTNPTSRARQTLLGVLNDERMPPNARTIAGDALKHTAASKTDLEAAYLGLLAVDVPVVRCVTTEYAVWLTESENRFDDARKVLERYVTGHEHCPQYAFARMLLAYTYLVAAAELGTTPNTANAVWIERAERLLDGDYSELARWLAGRPRESQLRPFVAARIPVDVQDSWGRTPLCRAELGLSLDAFRAENDRGADPNGMCTGVTLFEQLVVMASDTRHAAEIERLARLLIEYGGRPPSNGCGRNGPYTPNCQVALEALFREYGVGH
jgi:hypothetical protein